MPSSSAPHRFLHRARLLLAGLLALVVMPLASAEEAKRLRIGITLHPYYSYVANIVGDKAEVVGLVVDADARRAGAGRRLVAAAEDWARAQGMGELFLRSNVVRPEAHAFYPALGFERSKTQHVYRKALT